MINIFKHLLPRARAWRITIDKTLRKFFEGLTGLISEPRAFFEGVWTDLDPAYTNELDQWENQFALPETGLSEDDRRDRLDGAWKAFGGQSPRYIQDTLQGAGFDVYVHEWWWSTVLPVLEIPFENNLSVARGVGVVSGNRASAAASYIRQGTQVYAAANTARVEDAGVLMEGKRINLVYQSIDPLGSAWALVGDAVSTLDGTMSSDNIYELGKLESTDFTDPNNYIRTNNPFIVDTGQKFSYSIEFLPGTSDILEIRTIALTGGVTIGGISRFNGSTGMWVEQSSLHSDFLVIKLNHGGYRVGLAFKLANTGNTRLNFRISGEANTPSYIYYGHPQIEEGDFVSSYIPNSTVSAVTRDEEAYTIPVSGNVPDIVNGDYSVSVVTDVAGLANALQFIYSIQDVAFDALQWDNADLDKYVASTVYTVPTGTADPVAGVKIVSVVQGDTLQVYINGVLTREVTGISRPATNPTTDIYFGNRAAIDAALFGHIRDFRIYDQALTAEQLQFANPPRGKFDAPVLRDPTTYLDDGTGALPFLMIDGGSLAQDGGSLAQDGSTLTPVGYPLVNKIVSVLETVDGDGSAPMQDGGIDAQDGRVVVTRTLKQYIIPPGPDAYHYFLYIGGEEFPAQANIINSRREELEDLCLKICPTEQWLGMLVNYN